jgi:hypothetical protein
VRHPGTPGALDNPVHNIIGMTFMTPTIPRKRSPPRPPHQRLNEALVRHLLSDFDANGADVIGKIRASKPLDYLKMITALLKEEASVDAALTPLYSIIERQIVAPDHSDR